MRWLLSQDNPIRICFFCDGTEKIETGERCPICEGVGFVDAEPLPPVSDLTKRERQLLELPCDW